MEFTDRTASYIILLVILGFALVWEGIIQALEGFCPSQLRPMVDRVVVELAELGLVSLLVYIPSQSAWFLDLSSALFGDCHHLLGLIHDTHFLVFYGMASFLVFVICITLSGSWWMRQWHSFEASAQKPTEEMEVQRHFKRARFFWYQYVFFAGLSRMDYRLIRRQFLREVNADELRHSWEVAKLPPHFEFNAYLKRQQSTFYVQLVNVMGTSWITLFVVIGICYFTLYLDLWLDTTLVVVAQGFLLLVSLSVHIYCVWIYQRLFPWTISDTFPTIRAASSLTRTLGRLGLLQRAAASTATKPDSDLGYKQEASQQHDPEQAGHIQEVSVPENHEHSGIKRVAFEADHEHIARGSSQPASLDATAAEIIPVRSLDRLSSGRSTPTLPSPEGYHTGVHMTPMPSLQSMHESVQSAVSRSTSAADRHTTDSPPPYGRQRRRSPRSLPPDFSALDGSQVDVGVEYEDEEEEEQARRANIPRNHMVHIRFIIQVVILLSGVNNAFFIDLAAPYLVEACGLSSPGLSYFIFALHILMLLAEISSLLQTIRINTFLCSTGTNKNYASISWVLHHMELRGMLQHLKELQLGDKEYSSTKALANDLFDRLDIDKNGVVSAKEVHMCLSEITRDYTYTLSAHDVLGVMRYMDSDGDGYISRQDFLTECRYILEL